MNVDLRWLVPLAALCTQAALAVPVHSWQEDLSARLRITSVVLEASAAALDGARASVFYSDGSSAQALFLGFESAFLRTSVASAPEFVLVATTDGSDLSFPALSISNLDRTRTLTGFRIDGRGDGDGHAAFDRGLGSFSTNPSTEGSSTGRDLLLDFDRRSFLRGTVDVTYSNPLGLGDAAPVGDLFSTVDVRLDLSTVIGLPPVTAFGAVFSSIDFSTDIDSVTYAPLAGPGPDPGHGVPAPSMASLLLAALATWLLQRSRCRA
jgi:hypothetical protein